MHTLLHMMFLLLATCGIVGFILQSLLFLRLRQRHTEVWQTLGQPGIFGQGGSVVSVVRFLWRREYRSFSDVQSVRLAGLFRGCLAIFTALFVCTLIVFAVSFWR
jgi:hypothetical protein